MYEIFNNHIFMISKIFTIIVLALTVPLFVFAQDTPPSTPAATIIANINISDATILSREADGSLLVGFTIVNNGTQAQADVRFGLDIVQKTDKGQTIVDSFVSEHALSIAPGVALGQTLRYPAPAFLSGEYEVWVIGKTTGGVMLGLGMAGTATFSNTQAYAEIIPNSCTLQVQGDEKSYNLYQGVDVAPEEVLLFSCTLQNHSAAALTVTPYFDTYRRSMYGEKVSVAYPAARETTLTPKERKNV